jgi:hypothetical protein
MYRFAGVVYNPGSQTAASDIGASLVWDDVYAALEPHRVNVFGGRTTRVGVAGFTLGGLGDFEYSWISHLKESIQVICRRIFMENELLRFEESTTW